MRPAVLCRFCSVCRRGPAYEKIICLFIKRYFRFSLGYDILVQVILCDHCIFGYSGEECYLGIPGRFLKREQPCREEGWFLLWQPLRGGEAFFDRCESMDRRQQEEIFGYWIAGIDMDTGVLKPL